MYLTALYQTEVPEYLLSCLCPQCVVFPEWVCLQLEVGSCELDLALPLDLDLELVLVLVLVLDLFGIGVINRSRF